MWLGLEPLWWSFPCSRGEGSPQTPTQAAKCRDAGVAAATGEAPPQATTEGTSLPMSLSFLVRRRLRAGLPESSLQP